MIALLGAAAAVALLMLFGVLNATGFFRALPLLLLLFGLSLVSVLVAEANLGRECMPWAGVGVPAALMLWSARRPASSRAKLWIMDGTRCAMSSGKWLALIAFALTLPIVRFHLDEWLVQGWGWAVLALVAWCLERLVDRWTMRSLGREPGALKRMQSL